MKFFKGLFIFALIVGAFILGYYACKLGWIDQAITFVQNLIK